MKKKFLLFVFALTAACGSFANNVVVSSVSLGPKVTTGALATHYTRVNYDITWENSWRTSTNESNYDGCWIFVKYRKQSTSAWQHATINIAGQSAPTGSTIKTAADGKGVWMYRSADGIGTVTWAGAGLRWDYGADGVLDLSLIHI